MELIDTPNPNAKKIMYNHGLEIASYIQNNSNDIKKELKDILNIKGVKALFTGPGFLTITKENDGDWSTISSNIKNIFDTI